MADAVEDLTFEDAYRRLDEIVQKLEGENLPLDEALKLFEKGQALSAYCQKLLDTAELKVSQLMGDELAPLGE